MAQFYRRMGSRVTVIEPSAEIATHEDEEVARALRLILESEEIAFRLETSVERVEKSGDSVRMVLETKRARDSVTVSHLFVATGRQPNTDDLGLETIGSRWRRRDDPGLERLATKWRGVWAPATSARSDVHAHGVWRLPRLVSQLAGDRPARTVESSYAIYTDPQLGRVG